MEQYIPQPKNLDGVIVYGPFRELVNKVAAKAHQNWMAERIKEGKTLSELPDLKPWNELTDAQKASSLDSAEQAVKLLMHDFPLLDMINGGISFDREKIVDAVAENAHEIWARQRMDAGWTYGEICDNDFKKHPMLKPYDELPESEKAYDKAYGEIAFDEIEKMAAARKEMIQFGERWGLDIDSREFKELYQFTLDFEQLSVQQRLDMVNDVIGDLGRSDDLVEFREMLLSEKVLMRDIPESVANSIIRSATSNLEASDLSIDSTRALKKVYDSMKHGMSAGKTMKSELKQLTPEEKTKARRAKSASIYKSLVAAERNRSQGIKIK